MKFLFRNILLIILVFMITGCNSNKIKVIFMTGENNLYETVDVGKNNRVTLPNEPYLEKFVFDGWFKDLELTIAFNEEEEITEDIIVYAKWLPINIKELKLDTPINLIHNINEKLVYRFFCDDSGDYLLYTSSSKIKIKSKLYKIEDNKVIFISEGQFVGERLIHPNWLDENTIYEIRLEYIESIDLPSLYIKKN